jgi:SAM-dependent methyltransferase
MTDSGETISGATSDSEPGHLTSPGNDMAAAEWDERYRQSGLVWGSGPNVWVAEQVAERLPVAGTALDLGCGEGRNAAWLARRGWRVTGVDFSAIALEKAAALERAAVSDGSATETAQAGDVARSIAPVRWVHADATSYVPTDPVDLVVMAYLQLPAEQRRAAVTGAVAALAPGGVLLVIGHHSRNIAEGVGGPQRPEVLFSAEDLLADVFAADPEIVVDLAEPWLRPVSGSDRPAIDAVLRAHRPIVP